MTDEMCREECRFAKVVTLPDGSQGLLIGGTVIQLTAPYRSLGKSWVEIIASALRPPSQMTAAQVASPLNRYGNLAGSQFAQSLEYATQIKGGNA